MLPANLLNIIVHVTAGTLGLGLGFSMLVGKKGTPRHRKRGRVFAACALVVCLSATIGLICFRFLPLFAVLTVLVLYQLVSGWRAVYTRDSGPAAIDAVWTAGGLLGSVALVPVLMSHIELTTPVVLYSTLAGLAAILLYDLLRWAFPRNWHKTLWLYEHAYKMIATLFGMLSALVGNVVRFGQPWSQILPSALGLVVITLFFVKIYTSGGSLTGDLKNSQTQELQNS